MIVEDVSGIEVTFAWTWLCLLLGTAPPSCHFDGLNLLAIFFRFMLISILCFLPITTLSSSTQISTSKFGGHSAKIMKLMQFNGILSVNAASPWKARSNLFSIFLYMRRIGKWVHCGLKSNPYPTHLPNRSDQPAPKIGQPKPTHVTHMAFLFFLYVLLRVRINYDRLMQRWWPRNYFIAA